MTRLLLPTFGYRPKCHCPITENLGEGPVLVSVSPSIEMPISLFRFFLHCPSQASMYREVLAPYELSTDELVEAINEGAGIVLALELEPRARVVWSDDVETLASGVPEEGDVPEVHGPRIGACQAPSIDLDPIAVQAHLARLGGRRDEDRILFHVSHPGFHGSVAASLTRQPLAIFRISAGLFGSSVNSSHSFIRQ